MTTQSHSPLLNVLSRVTLDRLQKAVDSLAANTYSITFTTRSDTEISAYVTNGDGKEYAVTLTSTRAFCSCKDSMFRHTVCKHTVAAALQALRTPAEQPQRAPVPPPPGWIGENWNLTQPITHLMRPNAGAVVCGERHPERILYWPWPETLVNNQTQWPEITVCPDCVRERNAPDLRLGKVKREFDAAA